jgi:hypothetical protein
MSTELDLSIGKSVGLAAAVSALNAKSRPVITAIGDRRARLIDPIDFSLVAQVGQEKPMSITLQGAVTRR